MSVAEQRAEERYRRRMAGVQFPAGEELLPALNVTVEADEASEEEKQELLHVDYTMI